jgi:hypothetical protein
LYAVEDCKISKMTSDPAGAPTVYGTSVDVPGIKSVGVGGEISSAELRGDNTILAQNSALANGEISIEHAKISLDVLAIILGGTVTDAGTTPNQTSTYARGSTAATDVLSYFKLEAKTPTSGVDFIGGDAHLVFYKCIITEFPEFGLAEEDFQTISFTARCFPPLGTPANRWFDIKLAETAAAIA